MASLDSPCSPVSKRRRLRYEVPESRGNGNVLSQSSSNGSIKNDVNPSPEKIEESDLLDLAKQISPSQIPDLGFKLGFNWAAIERYMLYNKQNLPSAEGVMNMLYDWNVKKERTRKDLEGILKSLPKSSGHDYSMGTGPSTSGHVYHHHHHHYHPDFTMAQLADALPSEKGSTIPQLSTPPQPNMGTLTPEEELQCRQELMQYYHEDIGELKTDPLDPESQVPFDSIYTNLCLLKEEEENSNRRRNAKGKIIGQRRSPKTHYGKLFKKPLPDDEFRGLITPGKPPYRILVIGEAGVGKTTFLAKLAHDWTTGKDLNNIRLLFRIPLTEAVGDRNFSEVVQDNLSDESEYECRIGEHVKRNQSRALLLFDGLDELGVDIRESDSKNDFVQIMRGEKYKRTVVVITTRPWRADQILGDEKLRKLFTYVTIEGFDQSNATDYVRKFFIDDEESSDSLVEFLEDDSKDEGVFSTVMASFPIYLAMLCHMWRDKERRDNVMKLQTVSQLLDLMAQTLKDHYASKDGNTTEERYQECRQEVAKCFKDVGGVAYQGVLKKQLVFKEEVLSDCGASVSTACEMGILTREKRAAPVYLRMQDGKRYLVECRFPHMLFQDYLAALHLASLHHNDPEEFERRLRKELLGDESEHPDRFEYLWYFTVSRGRDVGATTLKVLSQTVDDTDFIFRVAFECQDKEITSPITRAAVKNNSLRVPQERSFAAHIHSLDTVETLDIFTLNALPKGKAILRKGAEQIMSSPKIRSLALCDCGSESDEFISTMAKQSTSTEIEKFFHLDDDISCTASEHLAKALFSMPHLKQLCMTAVKLEEEFYATMAAESHQSRIERLCMFPEEELKLSQSSSTNFASGISSMSNLHTLLLQPSALNESFYSTLSETAASSKIEMLWVKDTGEMSPSSSQCLAKILSSLPCLQTLRLDSNHSILSQEYSFALTISSLRRKVRISTFILFEIKVTLQAMRTILSLETMRELRMMGVTIDDDEEADDGDDEGGSDGDDGGNGDVHSVEDGNGDDDVDWVDHDSVDAGDDDCGDVDDCDDDGDDDGDVDDDSCGSGTEDGKCCSTLAALALEGSLTSKVEVLAIDDESLSSVMESGIYTMCPHVQRLHLEFCQEEITKDPLEIIKKFPKTQHLSLKAYKEPLLPVEPPMPVSMEHATWLCNAIEASTNLRRLSLIDIMIGDENARSILHSTKRHGRLERVTMVSCATSTSVDELASEISSQSSLEIILTHGKPASYDDDIEEELEEDILWATNVFESAFTVISKDDI